MSPTPTIEPSDGEGTQIGSSTISSTASERASLLSRKVSNETDQLIDQNYGGVEADPEVADQSGGTPKTGREYSHAFIARIVIALLIGVFTANADGSLVMATHPVIGSEFNDLQNSSWLFIGFMLAGSATQSLYGKLSDIFGRKALLLSCYGLFAIGCALVGVGQTMWQVILGRVISGSGGAGMTVLAALIITDLAPLREVAAWQSYLNVIATTGRSLGGPVGGWLTDTIGWRWSFLGQAPIFAVAMAVSWFILPPLKTTEIEQADSGLRHQLSRIDFAGALLLGLGIFSLMLPLEIAGSKIPWNHPATIGLFLAGGVLMVLFLFTEERWAKEPIFPVRLLRKPNVVLCYFISACQMAAQLSMMFSVPLYFQVTQRSSSTVAGAHLFPAVLGNTVGGIASGYLIKRTGRYKALVIFAALSAIVSYALLIVRWHGHTNWAESMYIIPGGLGTGIAQSAIFIALQTSIDPVDKAAATSALFLTSPVGAMTGMAVTSSVMVTGFRKGLSTRLAKLGLNGSRIQEVINGAAADVDYIDRSPPHIAKAIVDSYIDGIKYSHYVSLICSILALT
ncbi:major facilitator superfamily domain-containing protein [Xylariales sp. AK1849]|nr:major facilitator superfamily domain-containing protein [Xylariales sp. AK1849]